jgi:hypothetical protein
MTWSDERETPVPDTGMFFIRRKTANPAFRCGCRMKPAWLRPASAAELYQVSTRTISEQIINIYSDHELSPEATIRKFRLVQIEGSLIPASIIDY